MLKPQALLKVLIILSTLAIATSTLPVASQTQRSLTVTSIGPSTDPQGNKVLFWHDNVETQTPRYQSHSDVTLTVVGTCYVYMPKVWEDYLGNWWVYSTANVSPKTLSWVQTSSGNVKVVEWALPDAVTELQVTFVKKRGPAEGGEGYLYFKMYYSPVTEWSGLKVGEIDVMDWSLSKSEYEEWSTGGAPGVSIEDTKDLGMFEFDLNCNDTVDGLPGATHTYPGIPNPTADAAFRRAIAKLVDKVEIATQDFGGIMEVMDVPLASPVHEKYINQSVTGVNYAFKFNPASTVIDLDAAGYVKGKTANPYYDSSKTWSSDKIRINPKTGNDLYELIFYIRQDKPDRIAAGLRFTDMLRKVGIPVKPLVAGLLTCYYEVMVYFGYNLYTGGWALSRDPDSLHDFYTGEFANPYDYNYMIHNAKYVGGVGPIIKDPNIEAVLDGVKYSASLADVIKNAKDAQSLLWGVSGTMPSIILGHYTPMRTAYRSNWKGIINGEGVGVRSWWTSTVGYVPGPEGTIVGDTMRIGLASIVSSLNPVTAEWLWDWEILEKTYDSLLGPDPYILVNDMPVGLADWWRVGTWDDAGTTKTKLTFHLRNGVTWHNGNPVTVDDVKFSIEYHKEQLAWFYSSVMDVKSVDVNAVSNEVYVYMDVAAYLSLHWVGGVPILQKAIWQNVPDAYAYDPMSGDANSNGVTDLIEDGTGPWAFTEFVADDHVLLESNEQYFLYTEDMQRLTKEAFHRRGDNNYDAKVDLWDLAVMSKSYSSLPYQSVPTWTDDQYPNMIYSPPNGNDPFSTGLCPPFDPPFPTWKKEDANSDSYVDIIDLTVLSKYWHYRAGSGW